MIIRREQQEAFARARVAGFEVSAVTHLRKTLPDRIAGMTDDQLIAWVRDAATRAATFNLTTERQIICFLDAEVLLGMRFYESKEQAWAAQVLTSEKLNPEDKSGLLLATACSVYQGTGQTPPR